MGIKNFYTYVTHALKLTTSGYNNEGRATTPPPQTTEVRPQVKQDYLDGVLRLCCAKLDIPPEDFSLATSVPSGRKTVEGICVDLSSFCYWPIVEVVAASCSVEQLAEEVTPPQQQQPLEEGIQDTLTVFDDVTGFGSRKRKGLHLENVAAGVVEGKKVKTASYVAEVCGSDCLKQNNNKTVVELVLEDCTIKRCAAACLEKVLSVIGRDAILNAHYVSLHFDENTTSCKWYAQYKRKAKEDVVVSKESRDRVFLETINLVRQHLEMDTRIRVVDAFEKKLSGCCNEDEKREKLLQQMTTCDGLLKDVVLEKMILPSSCCANGTVVSRQRYTSGEGEWKCFYTISDVESETRKAPENDGVHCRWRVFGQDSDIGLGVLLYTSASTSIEYVNVWRKSFSFTGKWMLSSTRSNAYRALHMLALNLLGNDYVPRLVNESAKNITALGGEVERMLYSERKHCGDSVDVLSKILQERDHENDRTDDERVRFSKAIAYVFANLLSAVYDKEDSPRKQCDAVEDCCAHRRRSLAEDQTPFDTNDKTRLRCKDGRDRSFTECVAAFAARTLWYTAYCLFYKMMDSPKRDRFQTTRLRVVKGKDNNNTNTDRDCDNWQMCVPGVPMKTPFVYNERRLHDVVQFELANTVDMRKAVRGLTTHSLLCILENTFLDVLQQ